MLDFETQKELLRETVSSTKALKIAIHMKMGALNQQKINQNLNTTAQSVNIVNSFQNPHRTTNYQQHQKDFTRYATVSQNYKCIIICANCGQRWTHNYCQICPV